MGGLGSAPATPADPGGCEAAAVSRKPGATVLALFEDLHWIDTETQALLDVFVDSLPSTPILVLVNYRPEYEHRWASKTYYTQLPLDPLGPDSEHELIHALLGGDPGYGRWHAC